MTIELKKLCFDCTTQHNNNMTSVKLFFPSVYIVTHGPMDKKKRKREVLRLIEDIQKCGYERSEIYCGTLNTQDVEEIVKMYSCKVIVTKIAAMKEATDNEIGILKMLLLNNQISVTERLDAKADGVYDSKIGRVYIRTGSTQQEASDFLKEKIETAEVCFKIQ